MFVRGRGNFLSNANTNRLAVNLRERLGHPYYDIIEERLSRAMYNWFRHDPLVKDIGIRGGIPAMNEAFMRHFIALISPNVSRYDPELALARSVGVEPSRHEYESLADIMTFDLRRQDLTPREKMEGMYLGEFKFTEYASDWDRYQAMDQFARGKVPTSRRIDRTQGVRPRRYQDENECKCSHFDPDTYRCLGCRCECRRCIHEDGEIDTLDSFNTLRVGPRAKFVLSAQDEDIISVDNGVIVDRPRTADPLGWSMGIDVRPQSSRNDGRYGPPLRQGRVRHVEHRSLTEQTPREYRESLLSRYIE